MTIKVKLKPATSSDISAAEAHPCDETLVSEGESKVVELDAWLVGRSGYTGMRALLFV